MIRRRHKAAVWLCGLALLVNVAAQATSGTVQASVGADRPGGPVIVICSPEGLKRLVWTPDGFIPLPSDPGTTKLPCPFCSLAFASAVLPELASHRLPWAMPQTLFRPEPNVLPISWPCASAPPARAPPVAA